MDEEDALVTFQSFVNTFTDFLTVAIHTILYERNIYPQTSFLSARKYNFSVRQNRHPKVCNYITDAVAAVEAELLKGTVERVLIVIYDKSDSALERFVFDVSFFPYVPPEHQTTPLRQTQTQPDDGIYILPRVDLEEQLRGTMSRLSTCSSNLKPIPEGCTFAVVVELKEQSREPPLGHPQPWIPVQPSKGKGSITDNTNQGIRTTPLRNVEAGYMIFESWIDEAKVKFEEQESSLDSSRD